MKVNFHCLSLWCRSSFPQNLHSSEFRYTHSDFAPDFMGTLDCFVLDLSNSLPLLL